MRFLCRIGWHDWGKFELTGSIRYFQMRRCASCGLYQRLL